MMMAVHNPSSLDHREVRVLLPPGTYYASLITNDQLKDVDSTLQCYYDFDQDLKYVETCTLIIYSPIPAKEVALF